MEKKIKIAYIGGGSKMWARVFMNDLALTEGLGGSIYLYDIDEEAATRNYLIGNKINLLNETKSKFEYVVAKDLKEALTDANFVIISILPGTFKEMEVDVHEPEKLGIYQSVGDTAGPGGILRAMRTVPIYEGFAKAIKEICPNAWVINFTNPMSICVKTLYDVFPQIKAFGCCHEVFHAEEFLCLALRKELGIKATRKDIYVDVSGVNHFTWITKAYYKDIDLLKLLPNFIKKYYDLGYYEGGKRYQFKYDTYAYGNKVKMDLFNHYGILAAAGDRHLVEFMDCNWYLKNPKMVKFYKYGLTTVKSREINQQEKIEESIKMANGQMPIVLEKSSEEAVDLLKALLGFKNIISNVNMPNYGQMPNVKLGSIVESNALFLNDNIKPIMSSPLQDDVLNLVNRASLNIDSCYEGIKNRDLNKIFNSFVNQALVSGIDRSKLLDLFKTMVLKTKEYLLPYYDLSQLDNLK